MDKVTVIGLVGEINAGKGTVAEMITFKGASPNLGDTSCANLRFSQILSEILGILGQENSRKNLQDLAIALRRFFGDGVLATAMKKKIKLLEELGKARVVIDGLRDQTEYEMLRSFPGSVLIYITASVETRYERTKAKKEKVGEQVCTFEEFLSAEKRPTEIQISLIAQNADFKIVNEGTKQELRENVLQILEEIEGERG